MRRPLPYVIGLAAVILLGLFFLSLWLGRTRLPGTDLSRFHPTAVPAHIEALQSADAAVRSKAATTLWQMGAAARPATPALIEAAKDPDPEVRSAAVKALGRTGQGTPDAIPILIEALTDDHAAVRAAAAMSLAETWRVADKVSTGERPGVRRPALEPARPGGRGRSGVNAREVVRLNPSDETLARKAVPHLTAALRDADAHVRANAAEALSEVGPSAEPAVPNLVEILQKDADRDARLQATLALGHIGPAAKAAVPVLVEKLRGEKADGVRVNTAVALGMIRSEPRIVVPALVETFLTDDHPDARGAAMFSIGQFGPEAKVAIPLLESAKGAKNQPSKEAMQNIDRLLKFIESKVNGGANRV